MSLKKLEQGSILVLSSFICVAVALISLSLWKLLEYKSGLNEQKKHAVRAELAARAGLEDALFELSQGHEWEFNGGGLSPDWEFGDTTSFFKTNQTPDVMAFWPYWARYDVEVLGNIENEPVTINATGTVRVQAETLAYMHAMQARVSRSFYGDIHMHSLVERELE